MASVQTREGEEIELQQLAANAAQIDTLPDENALYPSNWKLAMITIGLSLSIFLAALDSTIVAQAIPSLTDQYGSISNIAWYGTAYSVSNTAFNSPWGKAYKYFPLKPTYLIAIAIFELGNVICGTAQTSQAVVAGRVVAGLGGAGIMSGSFIIIALTVKPQYRAAYMGVLGVTFGCASVVGPLLGGALVDLLNWRWCFLYGTVTSSLITDNADCFPRINLPLGALAAAIMVVFFSQPRTVAPIPASLSEKLSNMDLNGGVIVAGALSCFVLAMHWAGAMPWNSLPVIGSLTGSALLAVVFVLNEAIMGSKAMIQSHLLKKWNIASNSLFAFLIAGVYFPLLYILPIQFQSVDNNTAAESGVRLIPLVLGISIFSMLPNALLTRWRLYGSLLVVGAVAGTIGVSKIYTLDAQSSTKTWIGYELLTAMGIGISLQVPMIANQAAVGLEDIPAATSLSLFAENLGTALFVAASEAAFTNGLILDVKKNLPQLSPAIVVNAGVTQLRTTFTSSQLPVILTAYLEGCKISHIVSVACGGAAVLLSVASASPTAAKRLRSWVAKTHTR